jgi:hypothetical protein
VARSSGRLVTMAASGREPPGGLLSGSVHDAAQRAADSLDVLLPRPGSRDEIARLASPGPRDERARLLAGRAHPPRLTSHGGESGWHLHVDSRDDAPWAEWFLTSSCLALAVLLAERQALPAGLCGSPSCGKPFVNVGRGAARRYCSATCGTRERVAAHRHEPPA